MDDSPTAQSLKEEDGCCTVLEGHQGEQAPAQTNQDPRAATTRGKWRKVKKQWRAAAPKKTAARGPAGSKWNRQLKNGEKQSEPGSPARPEI